MGWAELFEHARQSGGVFPVREAPTFGLTPDQVAARARREVWDRPFRGQVVVPGAVKSHRRRLWSALKAVGGEALIAGDSALWLHGVGDQAPARVDVLVGHDRRVRGLGPGVVVHRTRTLEGDHVTTIDDVPVTTMARTIGDKAAKRDAAVLRPVIIDARQQGRLDLGDLLRISRQMAGSTGMPFLRQLCWELDENRCDSVLAAWLWDELVAAGLRPDAAEHPVPAHDGVTVHFDLAWIREQVAGEAHGLGAHGSRRNLNSDARRRNTLRGLPWAIIEVTWDMLDRQRDQVIEDFRIELGKARSRLADGLPPQPF